MYKDFKNYIKEKRLFGKRNRILLAVSGGIDSVVLLNLMLRAGYKCSMVHCNFKLRGEESDEDERFVSKLSKEYKIKFFSTTFDTEKYALEESISIQMAARDLRYSWFEKIRLDNAYDFIAIAHNLNDIIETFMINMSRGTGLPGLTGIKSKKGSIVRPLLFATREDIMKYSMEESIAYREDSSNESNKYLRNRIRNMVIPVFAEINPAFHSTMMENIKRLDETSEIFFHKINEEREKLVIRKGEFVYIDIKGLQNLNPISTYLYEFIRPFAFTRKILKDIIGSLDNISGKVFFSAKYKMIKDRDKLIIYPKKSAIKDQFFIDESLLSFTDPLILDFRLVKKNSRYKINMNKSNACIDYDLLEFPLVLRKWNHGDHFMPLGMKRKKKLSDFFIDNKIPIPEKENAWILCSGNNIVWLVGRRLDERYKIRDNTVTILEVSQK